MERRRQQVGGLMPQIIEQAEPDVPAPELQVDLLPCDLAKCQREDSTLVHCFKEAEKEPSIILPHQQRYVIENDLLYRLSEDGRQLVLPKPCREEVLRVGHTIPWAGHLGFMKTLLRISKRFCWPGMYSQVKEYCKTCPECQLTAGKATAPVPLMSLVRHLRE